MGPLAAAASAPHPDGLPARRRAGAGVAVQLGGAGAVLILLFLLLVKAHAAGDAWAQQMEEGMGEELPTLAHTWAHGTAHSTQTQHVPTHKDISPSAHVSWAGQSPEDKAPPPPARHTLSQSHSLSCAPGTFISDLGPSGGLCPVFGTRCLPLPWGLECHPDTNSVLHRRLPGILTHTSLGWGRGCCQDTPPCHVPGAP